METLFDIEDDGVARGNVGIGTNKDARNTYFKNIDVQPFDEFQFLPGGKEEEHREYNECILPKSLKKR